MHMLRYIVVRKDRGVYVIRTENIIKQDIVRVRKSRYDRQKMWFKESRKICGGTMGDSYNLWVVVIG